MAYRRRTSMPQLDFKQSDLSKNPFLNKQLLQRRHSLNETEDCLTKLTNDEYLEKENHLHELGEIIIKPSKFQLILDLMDLKSEDLKIQSFRKGFFVTAQHKKILDNGKEYLINYFYREYLLPKEIIPNKTKSWITIENLLFIEAPKKIPDKILNNEDDEEYENEVDHHHHNNHHNKIRNNSIETDDNDHDEDQDDDDEDDDDQQLIYNVEIMQQV